MSTLALILAGGAGPDLHVLTANRSDAAVPFGGKYRVIDFALSNCVNSNIFNVSVLTQYMPRSLNEHIRAGKPWDLDRDDGGVRLLHPYQATTDGLGTWEQGSSDAIRFNLDVVRESRAERILVLAGNHIYKMNYQPMVEFHQARRADVTVGVLAVPAHQTQRFGMVTADADGRITRFEEKPRRTRSILASMGIYIFNAEALNDVLLGTGQSHRQLGRETVPWFVKHKRVFAYEFEGYWANVSTIPAYYAANMGLLADIPALDLSDPRWVIHTQSEQRPPVLVGAEAQVNGNLLCDGALIEGKVVRSVLGPGVYVAPGAEVHDSIIMNDTVVGPGAVVDRAILDKHVTIGEGAVVGHGSDNTPNSSSPGILNTGITVVGKRASIPAGMVVGRNVILGPHARVEDFPAGQIASGTTLR